MKYIGELSASKREELKALTAGTHYVDKLWNFEMELDEVLSQLLRLWEEAEAVLKDQGPRAFYEYYQGAEANKKADPLRFNICKRAVADTHFLSAFQSLEGAQKYADGRKAFRGRPKVFRLLSGAGNPNWKRTVSVKAVVLKARELWDEHGAERYHFKDRRGKGYPQAFLEDIAEALHAEGYTFKSLTTIRQRLRSARFEMPSEAYLYRVHRFFK